MRTALRSTQGSSRQLIQSRSLHSLPPLPGNLQEGKGCSPLFSSISIKLLWNDFHGGLLKKLNDEVRGTQWENSSIVETVIGTARDPQHILAFNYASMALNNSFFLSNLKPKPLPAGVTLWEDVQPPKPPVRLLQAIEENFDSLSAFKLAFSSAAYGMSGSGYVWLVIDREGTMGIVPTYGAGTILVQNRIQRDGARDEWLRPSIVDQPNLPPPTSQQSSSSYSNSRRFQPFSARVMSTSARVEKKAASRVNLEGVEGRGEELYPLLCISVHERDWLPDYGMWGKEEYLMRWYECVDWNRVFRLWESYTVDR